MKRKQSRHRRWGGQVMSNESIKVRWLDANHHQLRTPIYLGKLKPGERGRQYLYVENLDHRLEDIQFWAEPEWIHVASAPTRLDTGQSGKIILEWLTPYDLEDPPVLLFAKAQKVRII